MSCSPKFKKYCNQDPQIELSDAQKTEKKVQKTKVKLIKRQGQQTNGFNAENKSIIVNLNSAKIVDQMMLQVNGNLSPKRKSPQLQNANANSAIVTSSNNNFNNNTNGMPNIKNTNNNNTNSLPYNNNTMMESVNQGSNANSNLANDPPQLKGEKIKAFKITRHSPPGGEGRDQRKPHLDQENIPEEKHNLNSYNNNLPVILKKIDLQHTSTLLGPGKQPKRYISALSPRENNLQFINEYQVDPGSNSNTNNNNQNNSSNPTNNSNNYANLNLNSAAAAAAAIYGPFNTPGLTGTKIFPRNMTPLKGGSNNTTPQNNHFNQFELQNYGLTSERERQLIGPKISQTPQITSMVNSEFIDKPHLSQSSVQHAEQGEESVQLINNYFFSSDDGSGVGSNGGGGAKGKKMEKINVQKRSLSKQGVALVGVVGYAGLENQSTQNLNSIKQGVLKDQEDEIAKLDEIYKRHSSLGKRNTKTPDMLVRKGMVKFNQNGNVQRFLRISKENGENFVAKNLQAVQKQTVVEKEKGTAPPYNMITSLTHPSQIYQFHENETNSKNGDSSPDFVINFTELFVVNKLLLDIVLNVRQNQNLIHLCQDFSKLAMSANVISVEVLRFAIEELWKNDSKIESQNKQLRDIYQLLANNVDKSVQLQNLQFANHNPNQNQHKQSEYQNINKIKIFQPTINFATNFPFSTLNKVVKQIHYDGKDDRQQKIRVLKQNLKIHLKIFSQKEFKFKMKLDFSYYNLTKKGLVPTLTDFVEFINQNLKKGINNLGEGHKQGSEEKLKFQSLIGQKLERDAHQEFTLVLDLDETLVHFVEGRNGRQGQVLLRPFVHEFLKESSRKFEIIIFTAGTKDYADWAINFIDKEKLYISHRLYRQHTQMTNFAYVQVRKEVEKVSYQILQNEIFQGFKKTWEGSSKKQPENGIWIKTWLEDKNDITLQEILGLLNDLLINEHREDIRVALQKLAPKYLLYETKGLFALPKE